MEDDIAGPVERAADVAVVNPASVSEVCDRVRYECARIRMSDAQTAALVRVASELAVNQIAHAGGGRVTVNVSHAHGPGTLELVAIDRGPGIPDVMSALRPPDGRPRKCGSGLAAVAELADEIDIDVRVGEGTCIRARKGPSTVRRRQVGVFGRPVRGERTSGDDAAFARRADTLLVGLADGLGHGPPAREASSLTAGVLASHPSLSPTALLGLCNTAVEGTRGAVMTAVRVQDGTDATLAAVGNVTAYAFGGGRSERLASGTRVLGSPDGLSGMATQEFSLRPRDALVLYSDGLPWCVDLSREVALLREHPAVVAQVLLERLGRGIDDELVLVVV